MKKIYHPTTVTDTMDNLDRMRRLYRGANEVAKKLEDEKNNWKTVTDIFISSQELLRARLRDYCEKLIYQDFQGHGRKIDELLWRKGFYEVFCAAKKLRKNNMWSDVEKAMVSSHLLAGVGFYKHLILGLQLEYNFEFINIPNIEYITKESGLKFSISKSKSNSLNNGKDSEECKKTVLRFVHRSLVCIGDLARYRLDLDPLWIHWLMAVEYYKMAISIDHTIGMPYNQLGTVSGSQNYGLDAAYHYLRCILCPETFEGAESNLKRIVTMHSYTGNEEIILHRCISRLLSLLQLWDNEIPDNKKINQDSQDLLNDMQICLTMEPNTEVESESTTYFKQIKTTKPEYLTDEIILKVISICLMFIVKLQTKKLTQVQGATAFTLALLSLFVHFATIRIQKCLIAISSLTEKDFQLEDEEVSPKEENGQNVSNNGINCEPKQNCYKSRNLLTKLRRSRRCNSSDSDISDIENRIAMPLSDDDLNSDISETEHDVLSYDGMSDDLSEEIEDDAGDMTKNKDNLKCNNESEKDKLSELFKRYENIRSKLKSQEVIDVLANIEMLASIKICYDWLKSNPEVLRKCTRSATSLIKRTCKLINLINIDVTSFLETIKEDTITKESSCWELYSGTDKAMAFCHSMPLMEDVELRGISIIEKAHECLDWQKKWKRKMNLREETLIRVVKLVDFGQFLCSMKNYTGVVYNESSRVFHVLELEVENETVDQIEEEITDDISAAIDVVEHMNDIANNMVEQVANSDSVTNCIVVDPISTLDKVILERPKANNLTVSNNEIKIDEEKDKLMRNMGTLWLQAEVEALENRLHSKLMPPYLVPDHEVLVKYMLILKKLVYSKKFVVVIPSIVISTLDDMKRSSAQAREATRWLENQLEHGSRFLKAQRPNERLPLPLPKGPKPRDKESWVYLQIMECCHYLTQKTNIAFHGDEVETPVVTLLSGFNNQLNNETMKSFIANAEEFAKSAGINIEHIQVFHTKWKASSKSHG